MKRPKKYTITASSLGHEAYKISDIDPLLDELERLKAGKKPFSSPEEFTEWYYSNSIDCKNIYNYFSQFQYEKTVFPKVGDIIREILDERKMQDDKWGEQNHKPTEWLAILGEEFGEVSKAVCEAHFSGYANTDNWIEYRKELIQVSAVCIAMIECHDRHIRPVIRPTREEVVAKVESKLDNDELTFDRELVEQFLRILRGDK